MLTDSKQHLGSLLLISFPNSILIVSLTAEPTPPSPISSSSSEILSEAPFTVAETEVIHKLPSKSLIQLNKTREFRDSEAAKLGRDENFLKFTDQYDRMTQKSGQEIKKTADIRVAPSMQALLDVDRDEKPLQRRDPYGKKSDQRKRRDSYEIPTQFPHPDQFYGYDFAADIPLPIGTHPVGSRDHTHARFLSSRIPSGPFALQATPNQSTRSAFSHLTTPPIGQPKSKRNRLSWTSRIPAVYSRGNGNLLLCSAHDYAGSGVMRPHYF